eukprot:s296_g7.t1
MQWFSEVQQRQSDAERFELAEPFLSQAELRYGIDSSFHIQENSANGRCQDSVGGMSEALKQDPAVLNQFSVKRKLTESMSVISVAFKTGLREPPTNMRKHVRDEEIGKWRAQGLKKRTYSRTETVIL